MPLRKFMPVMNERVEIAAALISRKLLPTNFRTALEIQERLRIAEEERRARHEEEGSPT
jgi:hypothetical protein